MSWKGFWITLAIASIFVYALSPILMPFVAALIIAYLLNPTVEKMAKHPFISRGVASFIPISAFMVIILGAIAAGIPYLVEDISNFIQKTPEYTAWVKQATAPGGVVYQYFITKGINIADYAILDSLYAYSDQIAMLALESLKKAALGAMAVFDILSLLLIMPLVTFYVLYDWPKIVKSAQRFLPATKKSDFTKTLQEINDSLSAFLRGQGSVCLLLGLFYGIALTIQGLQMGFFIGLFTGLFSFIPFVGMLVGALAALGVGIMQYQFDSVTPYLIITAIFAVGQFLEGFIITPKLVGNRVGLHPVWVIFAVMAGGQLFGFLGVLIALPVATILTVLIPKAIAAGVAETVAKPAAKKGKK